MLKKLKGLLEVSENEIIGIASTEDTDRHNEVIKQEGWDFKNFKENPVFLLSHNYNDFPIGKIKSLAVKDGKLTFKAVFTEATQTAREAYQLVKEGILNAFSVGFIPKEFDKENNDVITKAELLEISLVAVPANPNAVVVAKDIKGNSLLEKFMINWLAEEEAKKKLSLKDKLVSDKVQKKNEVGEEGEKVEDIDLKKLQATTGFLQELCRQIKNRKGVENK